jgi:N6-adenosine-specific RNA methylase IME4
MKFNIIYMDPPWPYNNRRLTRKDGGKSRFGIGAAGRYRIMSMKDLNELPIFNIAEENCALHIWATGPFNNDCVRMVDAWNVGQKNPFRFINKAFAWKKITESGKDFFGPGYYYHSDNEDCWLYIRGRMEILDKSVRQRISCVHPKENKKIIHSRKPAIARDRIVQLFGDLPRIELFATEKIDGWYSTGYNVDGVDVKDFLLDSDKYINKEIAV